MTITQYSTANEVLQELAQPDNMLATAESFQFASETLRSNKSFLLQAVKINGLILYSLPVELQNDLPLVLAAIPSLQKFDRSFESIKLISHEGYRFLKPKLTQHNKPFILQIIKENNWEITSWLMNLTRSYDPSNFLFNDPEIMLAAISKTTQAYEFANSSLKDNDHFTFAAVISNFMLFSSLPTHKQTPYLSHLVLLISTENPQKVFEELPLEYKKDRQFLLHALRNNVGLFAYLPASFKAEDEFINLAQNKDLAFAALKLNPSNFNGFIDSLKGNLEFILETLKVDLKYYDGLPKEIQELKEVQLFFFQTNPLNYNTCLLNVKDKIAFFNEVCKIKPGEKNFVYYYLSSEDYQDNKEFVLNALRLSPSPTVSENIYYLTSSLKKDKEFILRILDLLPADKIELIYTSGNTLTTDEDIISALLKKSPASFKVLDLSYRSSPEFINKALRINPEIKNYVDSRFLNATTKEVNPNKEQKTSLERPPASPLDNLEPSTSGPLVGDFNRKKSDIQNQFMEHLKELNTKLLNTQVNVQPKKSSNKEALYRTLFDAQQDFFNQLTPELSKESLSKHTIKFRNLCKKQIDAADKIMGHGWLYQIMEVLIKAVVGLFVGIGMVFGSLAGQGLAKKEHRQKFKDTFFTLNQTDESKAIKQFEQKILGKADEKDDGLIAKQNLFKL